MANIGHFDSSTVDTTNPFEAFPPNRYVLQVTDSAIKEVKNKPGQKYIWLEMTVLEGDFKGRKMWANLNLWNSNSTAQKIAQIELAKLCQACGKVQITDTAELHGIPFTADITTESNDRGTQNRVKDYVIAGNAAERNAVVAQTTQTAQATAAAGGVPWAQG